MTLNGSKVMVPIDIPGSVSHSASIDPIVVSVIVFEIFDSVVFFHKIQS